MASCTYQITKGCNLKFSIQSVVLQGTAFIYMHPAHDPTFSASQFTVNAANHLCTCCQFNIHLGKQCAAVTPFA